jgi:glycosyltransferase involved in cell wall biosynthesis
MNIPALIPAYNPDDTLLAVVDGLIRLGFENIIIVDDGSSSECKLIFDKLENRKHCHVLHHALNLGKGRSIKTGLNYIYLLFRDAKGVITVDADGQHLPEDVLKVAEVFLSHSDALIIGSRTFGRAMPLRSLLGNFITQKTFGVLIGKKVSDTQSGLRCFPMNKVPDLIALKGERYEYEMNMLISTKTSQIDIIEAEITTIYLDNNRSSHFNPLIDSMKIYFLLLRFAFSSFFASIIDFIIFTMVFSLHKDILISIVFARVVAGNINFFINRRWVFHNNGILLATITKFYILFVVMGCFAFISIRTLAGVGLNVIAAKILTETLLFFASFSIQRDFIFVVRSRTGERSESAPGRDC